MLDVRNKDLWAALKRLTHFSQPGQKSASPIGNPCIFQDAVRQLAAGDCMSGFFRRCLWPRFHLLRWFPSEDVWFILAQPPGFQKMRVPLKTPPDQPLHPWLFACSFRSFRLASKKSEAFRSHEGPSLQRPEMAWVPPMAQKKPLVSTLMRFLIQTLWMVEMTLAFVIVNLPGQRLAILCNPPLSTSHSNLTETFLNTDSLAYQLKLPGDPQSSKGLSFSTAPPCLPLFSPATSAVSRTSSGLRSHCLAYPHYLNITNKPSPTNWGTFMSSLFIQSHQSSKFSFKNLEQAGRWVLLIPFINSTYADSELSDTLCWPTTWGSTTTMFEWSSHFLAKRSCPCWRWLGKGCIYGVYI